ncbi:MAG: vanadium-dependent haloperoxidase [Lysobacteraceae bacterium]|nr:MAG: vanadium-dependent haloperoxidase [Xanthomonadaceae bacterium]
MNITRRSLIKGISGAAAAGAAATTTAVGAALDVPIKETDQVTKALPGVTRRAEEAYVRRVRAAGANVLDVVGQAAQAVNTDETALPGYVGNFSKTLPHNELGEVDPVAYEALVDGLDRDDMSGVILSPQAERKLANPSAARSFDISGGDAHSTRIIPSPSLTSAHGAAEMIEVYWQALTRDVPFADYSTSALIADAAADLNMASYPIGPRDGGLVTADTIFRANTLGDLDGPYISQLLLQPINYGAGTIHQRYRAPVVGSDFMDSFDEYLAIQNGANPTRRETFGPKRYIRTNRDLANYVHNDVLFQAYYNGAMILLGQGGVITSNSPFAGSPVEGGFVTFGGPDLLNTVVMAARMALTGAWYQKWLQRKLRPEAFGARIDVQRRGMADYGIHSDVINSAAVDAVVSAQGNALLSQAFPEGSPTHPAYPAGHACVAGACATVLKAWVNEDAEFANPMVPSADGTSLQPFDGPPLTLMGEINKLANNISIGRNAAGVHYRTDGEQGMLAGEQQAIALLRDQTLMYTTPFDGFDLTRFDGTPIRIADGQILQV